MGLKHASPGYFPERNPAKPDLVENVQRNYVALLFVRRKVEMAVLRGRASRLSSPRMYAGAFRRDLINAAAMSITHQLASLSVSVL